MKRNIPKYKDIRGSLDRGAKETGGKAYENKGDILKAMSENVISTHHTTPVKEAAKLMIKNDVRRLPLTNAGTQRLEGIIAGVDILDYIGGGEKYNILSQEFSGNFLSAINLPVHRIMEPIQYLEKSKSRKDAVKIMVEKHRSCIPIVQDNDSLKVIGLVTERDVMPEEGEKGVSVADAMTSQLYHSSRGMMISDVAKVMVRNRVRRLPIIEEDKVIGIVTVSDILKYLADGHYKGVSVEKNLETRVEEIMEPEITALKPRDDLGKAINLVNETGLGGFPVIDDGQIMGILTITDILRHTNPD